MCPEDARQGLDLHESISSLGELTLTKSAVHAETDALCQFLSKKKILFSLLNETLIETDVYESGFYSRQKCIVYSSILLQVLRPLSFARSG